MLVNAKDGLILWTLGAAGTLLIYSAYKNHSPAETLKGYFTNTPPTPNIPGPVYGTYIPGPTYGPQLNTNGVDMNNLPQGYAGYPKNHVPLNVIRGN